MRIGEKAMKRSDFARISASAAAIVAVMLVASAANAQGGGASAASSTPGNNVQTQESIEEEQNRDIIVTGSAIRGATPIGSNLVSVGAETIEKTAPVNLSQLVN